MKGTFGGEAGALTARVFGVVLDLFASAFDVLARTFHRAATREAQGGKEKSEDEGRNGFVFHSTLAFARGMPVGK